MPEPADIIAGYHHTGQVDTDAVNDMARRLDEARTRVIEAAKAWSAFYRRHSFSSMFVPENDMLDAVDALEEAERG